MFLWKAWPICNFVVILWQALYGYFPLLLGYIWFMFFWSRLAQGLVQPIHATHISITGQTHTHEPAYLGVLVMYISISPTYPHTKRHYHTIIPPRLCPVPTCGKMHTSSTHSPTTTAHLVSSAERC
jgi:hypothetical protein